LPLPAEQLQQDQNSLARAHVGNQSQLTLQRPPQDADRRAGLKLLRLGQFDQAKHLARANFVDNAIRNARRPITGQDEAENADGPPRRVPLEFNGDKRVARKKRRGKFDLTTIRDATLTQLRLIGLIASKRQAAQRELLVIGLQARAGPIGHQSAALR
jgi:hypothetical protein